jgi:hypothetical protein
MDGKPSADAIYQLKVELRGSQPAIWRRLQVPAITELGRLHRILQIAMGWYDEHLHRFVVPNGTGTEIYGVPKPERRFSPRVGDQEKARLRRVARAEGSRFFYEYDFGDNWQHVITVEKIFPPEPDSRYPRCVAGKRAAPREDSGGVWAYADYLEALQDPTHPDHEDAVDGLGDDFEPERFDLEDVNWQLRRLR